MRSRRRCRPRSTPRRRDAAGKKLVDIAAELPPGPVRFTAAGESRVAIECGRSKFKLLVCRA